MNIEQSAPVHDPRLRELPLSEWKFTPCDDQHVTVAMHINEALNAYHKTKVTLADLPDLLARANDLELGIR